MGCYLLRKGVDATLVMFKLTPKVMKYKKTMQFLQMKMDATTFMKKILFFFQMKKKV
jgi:hypothetical protein